MRTCRLVAAALAFAAVLWLGSTTAAPRRVFAATDPCSYAGVNPIPCENSKPGTSPSLSRVQGGDSSSIMGFATDISVNLGGTISYKINTSSSNYTIGIYRIGYYQGLGARQIATITPSAKLPQKQPSCLTDSATGLLDCGNWALSASWTVPSTAVSGVYYALLTDVSSGAYSHIPFIVRDDVGHSDIVFKTNDTTWEAYNDYGGNSLYYGNTNSGCGAFGQYSCGRAYKVSYNRPFNDENEGGGYGTSNYVWYAEYPMVRWLESNGYNVSYISSIDVERGSALLTNHKVVLSSGHDEYWSAGERAALQKARDAGVSLAAFTGNTSFWKTRWENAIDGSNTAYRTLVCYKETLDVKVEDPMDPPTWTGTWRDPTFSPPADGGRPENALLGTLFAVNRGSAAPVIAATFAKLRLWRNTAVAALTGSQTATLGYQTIGYEWDADWDNSFRPAGLFDAAATSVSVPELIQDYGNTYAAGTAIWAPTLYQASSRALVFSAGTVQWAWGLDVNHDTNPDTGPSAPDLSMEQATVNLLADMQVQPATLQSGLVAAAASTDTTPPTSTITAPAAGANVSSGTATTISGTATDAGGGVVAGVEVSVDSGTTWHKANIIGAAATSVSWSYSWTPSAAGSVTIISRAVDDSANLETPSASVSVNVKMRSCPCTLFPATTTPASPNDSDPNSVEVGMKFTSDVSGSVTGIRFYKGSQNTGTHVGDLWTNSGTLLASVTFTNETVSGWQQATLSKPVAITAGTVYVVSYHTSVGHYAEDDYFFNSAYNNAPLHGLSTVTSPNGVYGYGPAGTFPTQLWNSSNYYVDVVLSAGPVTPTVTSTTPASSATGQSVSTAPTATFNENVTASSIAFTLTGPNNSAVAGTVSYNSSTFTATFTPSAGLAAATIYTATVSGATDSSGTAMTAPYTWTFTTIDSVPPTVTMTAPANGSAVSGSVTVSATASDNVAVASVQFLLDGNLLGTPITQAPYAMSWDSTTVANGSHTLSARATDTAGNSAMATAVTVTVSNTAPTAPVVDTTVAKDGKGPLSVSVNTTATEELLLAFVGSDGMGTQTVTVSGAGLSWTLVKRTNAQGGDAEIWSARATSQLSGATVTATQSVVGYDESLTVVAFQGAAGTGAVAGASAATGAPSVSLTTTKANSLVYGVGNDYDNAIGRTAGSGQLLVHQWLDTSFGDTYWVQRISTPVATLGTKVTINDTAPTGDQWNFAAVEIVAS
jgi:N,N-dimethylformamidase beta subunit-like protein/uncharacterized protein DUF4082/Big-like domain-containing protein